MPKIIAFPRDGIAYTDCLYAAVKDLGIEVVHGEWAGRWLLEHVERGDVIHIHWPSFLYFDNRSRWRTYKNLLRFWVFLKLIRLRGARLVWTAHNLYPHDAAKREWAHRVARHFVVQTAERVFAHSPSAMRILKSEFDIPDGKLVEIPHGHWIGYHPHTVSRIDARRVLCIPDDAYVYMLVGACKPYKNLEALIEAFARIDGNCFLLIVGHFQSEDYREQIVALLDKLPTAKYRLDPRFVGTEEVQTYLVAGDVLVLPYTEILTSGSAMLGLSFGVPVVTPNIGGMKDLITAQCGLLYESASSDGLVDAMKAVRLRTYSAQALTEYAQRFDWTSAAQALVRLLRN